MRTMADILHDPNPIHLHAAAAAAAGLGPHAINQGPANLAVVLDMLLQAFPGFRLETVESRFLANVRDGDDVEASGVVTGAEPDLVRCHAWLKVGDSTTVSVIATLVPRRVV